MAGAMFMTVNDVAEEMGISVSYAYRIIRRLNKELKEKGCIIIAGKIDRKYFHEQFYCTRTNEERSR